ncbi:hypothetical protein FLAG1_10439 [Fusarium langsethiae]|uniref:Zinc metalloprotease n=1 Tax=Fusarium langsethiae TaxID=179993 RepID=A0A0M9EP74_FUSLA|nr:hypothetical protein FLAG1_10439 [Fusarium langsethiae]
MQAQTSQSHFRNIQSFTTDYAPCKITQYESNHSGMQVVVAYRKGPMLNGCFVLPTEIFDDSGSPHALEHLIFLGSKSYQHKGLLDKLSSRAYSRTNASTGIDHTKYTLESAGWDGFAQILPIYLEHVILPTITDEGIVTEVWHIDGEGKDAGVVYSEMQSLQSSSFQIMELKARRLLYPENIGFRYETSGTTDALRILTPERIRQFHRDMYQPRNLCLVLVGEVNQDNLLQILETFEESIKDDIPSLDTPFQRQVLSEGHDIVLLTSYRPWIESAQPPKIKETQIVTAAFPQQDESFGHIVVNFFGPDCMHLINSSALSVLLDYLCGSSASILKNMMVENKGLASSISPWIDRRPNSVIRLMVTGVATDKLQFAEKQLIELLKTVASEPLDMDYMRECIRRERRQVKSQAETSHHFYATNIITDYLFGNRDGSTLVNLQNLNVYEDLEKWSDEQWRDFLKKWMVDAPHISILWKPSHELVVKMNNDEEARVAKRKEDLGADGLEKLAKRLEEAKKKNDEPIPDEVFNRWSVPGADSIHFIKSDTARSGHARSVGLGSGPAQKLIDGMTQGKLPLFIQFEDVPTNLVPITIHIGTSQVPYKFKPLIPIFNDNFFNTHITRDGNQVGFKQVVMDLKRDTIQYGLRSASYLGDPDGIMIGFLVEPKTYAAGVEWIRTMMFDSIFDAQRLKTSVTKALADIPESKRDGESMASEVSAAFHMEKSSLAVSNRVLVRAVYLKRLKELLEKEPEKVVGWFNTIRDSLFTFQNLRFLVTANLATLPDPLTTWDTLSKSLTVSENMIDIPKPVSLLNDEGRNPGSVGTVIVPMATLEGSYSVSTTKGIASYDDPRYVPIMVAIGYLEATEGPLWNAVRGAGYAYSACFSADITSGIISYKVCRSPDACKAIKASKEVISKIADGSVEVDHHLLQGTISQIVAGIARELSSMPAAAQENFVQGVVRGLPNDWNNTLLQHVRDVSIDQIKTVLRESVMPCFEPGKSNIVVTTAKIMQEGMEASFKEMGYKVQIRELDYFHDDYGLKLEDGEDEEPSEEGQELA